MSDTVLATRSQLSPRERFTVYWGKYSTVAILALIVAVFSVMEPIFITGDNLLRITDQGAITILLALGEFFAILLAGIDLSVGSVMALSGVITARLIAGGTPWSVALLLGVAAGGVIGFLNGALISITKLPPFIITLGTMAILRGATYVLSDARAVPLKSADYSQVLGGHIFNVIPTSIILVILMATLLILPNSRRAIATEHRLSAFVRRLP